MYKLIRLFNQNRKKIIRIILIIVFAFALLQILNYFAKNNNNIDSLNSNINNISNSNNYLTNNSSIISNKSLISGESLSEIKITAQTEIIEKFLDYCNNKEINNAYNMLTDECKEVMFPTISDFYNIYYLKMFDTIKTYTIENYNRDIYSVRITEDILSTGKLGNDTTKQDYITIIENKGEKKLNINNYISRTICNKETNYKNIKVTVKTIDTYMNYEIYNLTIENNSKDSIVLDEGNDTKSVYLLDENNMKYYFYSNEILDSDLKIESGYRKNLKIKFMNSYSSTRNIKNLVFSKMLLNSEENEVYYQFDVNL